MPALPRTVLSLLLVAVYANFSCLAQEHVLKNAQVEAGFGPAGLISVTDVASGTRIDLTRDAWSLTIDDAVLSSETLKSSIQKTPAGKIAYDFEGSGFHILITYNLEAGWRFVSKQITIVHAPTATFTVRKVVPWDLAVRNEIISGFVPSTYVPQFGKTIEQSRNGLPGKDFGDFLRFAGDAGGLLTVQNPYLTANREGQSVTIGYEPALAWQQAWGEFASDTASIGAYRLSGHRKPREMVTEWHPAPTQIAADGMDDAEIDAFTACVRAFLINPSPSPISVEVGWTLNDYQIDVGTAEGKAEYKRIIDTTSALGIQTLLYAPGNSTLADRKQSADSWSWEYVLWLNLGEKIRKGEWDPSSSPIPKDVAEMVAYAKQKHVGLLAYVYPSVPYAGNPSWLVKRPAKDGDPFTYSTLESREFQDYLIRNLVQFQKRTGIAGYSFDYTWLNLPGNSYAQWYGWRRVMEALRRAVPSIVIDGRQSYQMFGPWTWLAGSYPHPTGNDEQPESFKPYPDLHFDRVSADRTRFVNYWYRNYQFAPEEIIPGYATHQTERSRAVPASDGHSEKREMMYTRYRPRDWDYLGFRFSFISSIATGGWNNVVDMIPARDAEETKHFSEEDKAWIRDWLAWTSQHKEYLRHTRTILQQPAIGNVDGTSAIVGDRGFLFLFNPNYKHLSADFPLDRSIGLTNGEQFLLKEIYPQTGRLLGKPGAGTWNRGDTVHLALDGTSATVFEVIPVGTAEHPILFNAATQRESSSPSIELKGSALEIAHAAGELGTSQKLGVLLPKSIAVSRVSVNGNPAQFTQSGRYIETKASFSGSRFAQAQEVTLAQAADGSLTGRFVVPQRVLEQLADRKLKWPIPWTQEDYESTSLAPERLLLFVQLADGNDSISVTGKLDGQTVTIQPAYSSSRVDAPCFVGFYADLSKIAPDVEHRIELHVSQLMPGQLQGVFFDNVTPQLTESVVP
jgi:hypothetical protein